MKDILELMLSIGACGDSLKQAENYTTPEEYWEGFADTSLTLFLIKVGVGVDKLAYQFALEAGRMDLYTYYSDYMKAGNYEDAYGVYEDLDMVYYTCITQKPDINGDAVMEAMFYETYPKPILPPYPIQKDV